MLIFKEIKQNSKNGIFSWYLQVKMMMMMFPKERNMTKKEVRKKIPRWWKSLKGRVDGE